MSVLGVAWHPAAGPGPDSWHADGGSFSVDRGLGCLVLTAHQEAITERLRDLPEVSAVLAGVRESTIHPPYRWTGTSSVWLSTAAWGRAPAR
ncbi:hypothetical protein GCM10023168_36460 [Fodinibacter luteus]|uniref:Uncharacterized protein n=1 Tax=Fodinibacter luteus TaxID=552064 RepID=A0ABP8KRQ2_9MICO